MNMRLLTALLAAICTYSTLQASTDTHDMLMHRIDAHNKRYNSFAIALDLLNQRQSKVLVETGTARLGHQSFIGDGGSTILFGNWAARNSAKLYSIDHCGWAIDHARLATQPYSNSIQFICQDATDFLHAFNQNIDFLYLDSLNTFDANHPLPAQEQCLRELVAAYPLLTNSSVVMIDDCGVEKGGIGKLAGEFLLDHGWNIYHNGYQQIFVQ